MYLNAISSYLVFFSHGDKCNEKLPSKIKFSISLKIAAALDLLFKNVSYDVARGDLCEVLPYMSFAGTYAHNSCPLQSSNLMLQPFGKTINLWNNSSVINSSIIFTSKFNPFNAIGNFGFYLNFSQLLEEQVAYLLNPFYGYHLGVIAWQCLNFLSSFVEFTSLTYSHNWSKVISGFHSDA